MEDAEEEGRQYNLQNRRARTELRLLHPVPLAQVTEKNARDKARISRLRDTFWPLCDPIDGRAAKAETDSLKEQITILQTSQASALEALQRKHEQAIELKIAVALEKQADQLKQHYQQRKVAKKQAYQNALEQQKVQLQTECEKLLAEQRQTLLKDKQKSLDEQEAALLRKQASAIEAKKRDVSKGTEQTLQDETAKMVEEHLEKIAEELENILNDQKSESEKVHRLVPQPQEIELAEASEAAEKIRDRLQVFRQLRQNFAAVKDRFVGDLRTRLHEEVESKDIVEKVLRNEVANTDKLIDNLRDRVDEGAQYVGFQFPTSHNLENRVEDFGSFSKLFVSRMYRRPVERISQRLGLRCDKWPSFDLPPHTHNEEVHDILDKHVKNVVGLFEQMNIQIDDEKQRTEAIRAEWAKDVLSAVAEAGLTIDTLRAQLAAHNDRWSEVKDDWDRHFREDGVVPRLLEVERRQTVLIDEQSTRIVSLNQHVDSLEQDLERHRVVAARYKAILDEVRAAVPLD